MRASVSTCTMLFTFVRVTSEKIAQKLAIERTKEMYKAIKGTCKACENERLITFLSPLLLFLLAPFLSRLRRFCLI